MNPRGVLLPNVGAEEGAEAAPARTATWTRTVAGLWKLLFAADVGWLGEESPTEPWPAAWGERPQAAVFPWLEAPGQGTAWLNTAAAARRLAAASYPLAGPDPDVVRRVHDKAFAHLAAVREGLQPPEIADTVAVLDSASLLDADGAVRAIETALARWPAWARRGFTLKPRIGSSGRGRVAGACARADTEELRGALPRLAERGGAMLEPWLDRNEDLSTSMVIGATGDLTLLGTTRQCLAPSGLYLGQRGTVDSKGRVTSGSGRDEALREAGVAIARRAAAEGFWGPCGLDAFSFRIDGDEVFRPVVEFNARFTLGTLAIGLVRRGLAAIASARRLAPGDRIAFHFGLNAPQTGWPEAEPGVNVVPLWRDGDALRPALVLAPKLDALDRVLGPAHTR